MTIKFMKLINVKIIIIWCILCKATGGNTGVGMALICAALGYQTIFTMPEVIGPDKINFVKILGAEVLLQPLVPFNDPKYVPF